MRIIWGFINSGGAAPSMLIRISFLVCLFCSLSLSLSLDK